MWYIPQTLETTKDALSGGGKLGCDILGSFYNHNTEICTINTKDGLSSTNTVI